MQPVPASIARVLDRALAADPDREALVTRTRRLTYAELDAEANRAAHALRELGRPAGRSGGGVAAERRRRGGRLPRRHAPRRGVARHQPGPGARRRSGTCSRTPARRCCSATTSSPTSASGSSTWPSGGAAVRGRRRRAGRRRRRPVRARGPRLHERHHRPPEGGGAQPAQPAGAGRGARRDPRLRRDAAQGRLLPVHGPQHGRAHHAARVPGRRLLDRDGPHRRRGRGRVDPHRAGHHVERPAGAAAQPRDDGLDRRRRPGVARRGVDRRRRLPRGDPGGVRGEVRPAGARDLRPERGADRGVDRRPRRLPRRRGQRPAAPAPRGAHRRRRRRDARRRARPARSASPRRRPLPPDARLLGAPRGDRRRRWPAASCTPATSASSTTTATSTSATARAS